MRIFFWTFSQIDEEREKFLAALDEHISAEFLAECPEVRHLMQQHIDVFVKKHGKA